MLRRARGFTLIEVMLVVAIVALLASIAIPKFADMIDKAREASVKGQLGSLRAALTIYYSDNEGLYPKCLHSLGAMVGNSLDPKYINLDKMVFHIPRYVPPATLRYGSSVSGVFLYKSIDYHSDLVGDAAKPRYPENILGLVYPAYTTWAPAAGDSPLLANFKCGPRSDLRGSNWSLW